MYSVQNYDGEEIGTIDDVGKGSNADMQEIADSSKQNGYPLEGYSNGYIQIVKK